MLDRSSSARPTCVFGTASDGAFYAMLAVALTIPVGCLNSAPDSSPVRATFVLEQVFGEGDLPVAGILNSVSKVEADAAGNVYVLDAGRGSGRIVSYAPDGSHRWTLDARGEGPGELSWPHGFVCDGDSLLYIDNLGGTRVDRFSIDGSFIDTTPTMDLADGRAFVAGYLTSDRLVLFRSVANEMGARIAIVETRGDWTVVDSFTVVQTEDFHVLEGTSLPPLVSAVNNAVVVGHMMKYEYSLHHVQPHAMPSLNEGATEKYERRDVRIEPPAMWQSSMGPSFTIPSRMYPLVRVGDDLLLGGGTWPDKPRGMEFYRQAFQRREGTKQIRANKLDLFDTGSGELVTSLDAADFGIKELVGSDAAGYFYAELDGDVPTFGKFRVVER